MVAQLSCAGLIPKVTGAHWCATSVLKSEMSGIPVAAPALSTHETASSMLFMKSAEVPTIAKSSLHALMIAFRASSALRCESMKSTTSLRPARPPFELMYFAKA